MAPLNEIPEELFREPVYTEEQMEELRRFQTYLNYVKAIGLYLRNDSEPSNLPAVVRSRA